MGDLYSYDAANYDSNGDFLSSGPGWRIIDEDGDDQFEIGDNEPNGDYVGTVFITAGPELSGGLLMPVFQDTETGGGYSFWVHNSTPIPVTWPASLPSINYGDPYLFCFAAGSLIATNSGECRVEDLQIGDLVATESGTLAPVKWIGRQTVFPMFRPAERLMPVRFAAGSLGDGLPHTDLTVTADHAMLIDDVLIHAGALVNDSTITRVPLAEMGDRFTVYHIETEEHEIILANGAPAETFIDNVSRQVFDNYAEFEALYGDVPEMEELDYPRAMSARQVPAGIKARLGNRKAA